MSTKEKRFRNAARAYADRVNPIPRNIIFGHKGKTVIAKVKLPNDWPEYFLFDGNDNVSRKLRWREPWEGPFTVDSFEIAYGGETA